MTGCRTRCDGTVPPLPATLRSEPHAARRLARDDPRGLRERRGDRSGGDARSPASRTSGRPSPAEGRRTGRPGDERPPDGRRGGLRVLALAGLAMIAGCGNDDGGGVSFRVTELRLIRCAGTYNGSILRLVADNDGDAAVGVLRIEVGADPTAGIGDVRGTLAAAPDLALAPGAETAIVCSGGLPGAFSPIWDPPTVPVNVALVYGAPEAEQRLFVPAEIVIEYNAAPCPNVPVEPCRAE